MTVRLWDAATGALQRMHKGHSGRVASVAFSPDGRLIASGDTTVQLRDAATGTLLQILQGFSGGVTSVAFSLDSRLVVSGSGNEEVRIWDAATGKLRRILQGHSDIVNSIALSYGKVHGLSVSNEWITKEKKNILWLPSDYRATSIAIRNETIMLGHLSGNISYLKFI